MGVPLMFNGRLPGVVCESALPAPTEQPLRLDVAAFVGFAERGPLDTPIAVEDISQYQAIFGGDLLIARQGSLPIYSNLPGAVKAFFDNGGRRCYVVRVASDDARPNHFKMPGMVAWNRDDRTWQTVTVPAAWAGDWSDTMSIGTQLLSLPLRITPNTFTWTDAPQVGLELPTGTIITPGDILRLRFDGAAPALLYFAVDTVQVADRAITTTRGVPVKVKADPNTSLTFVPGGALPANVLGAAAATVKLLDENGWETISFPFSPLEEILVPASTIPLTSPPASLTTIEGYTVSVSAAASVHTGDLLRLSWTTGETLLFPVNSVDWQSANGSPPDPSAAILSIASYAPLWQLALPPSPPPALGTLNEVDLLSFNLYVREGDETEENWADLRFGPGANYWIDTLVPQQNPVQADPSQPASQLLTTTGSLRVGAPLNTSAQPSIVYLPLGMDELPSPDAFNGPLPETVPPGGKLPGKNGLDTFDPVTMFLDQRLENVGVLDLMNEANQILYLNPAYALEPLRKLHSLLPIDEIGMIAIPDLVQRGWGQPEPIPAAPEPPPPPPPAPPDWSHFQQCAPPAPIVASPPELPDHIPCEQPFAFLAPASDLKGLTIQEELAALPVLKLPVDYDATALQQLLMVQEALITLCAARSDVIAVLSLPQHFQQRETLDWQQRITGEGISGSALDVLSYAAVYHPWLQYPEEATPQLAPLRALSPDGAVCGMIAAREIARGPWIAPANVPLIGVVGLDPSLTTDDWRNLFNAQANIVRQLPGQFTLLSAHTLSSDPMFIHVSVRRLLIFLRKLVLRRGMRYVFETNNDRFRQRVQVSFERTLSAMADRGALNAFEVVTDSSVNTQNDYDNGRFIIAIKIAPTLPIMFITIVLLRAGEGVLQVIER